jgi:hypothetical protein
MKKRHIVARVRRPDGLVLDFRLPKDVTRAISVSQQTDWFERLRGGLIVVPMAPYVGKGETALFVGRIERVYYSDRFLKRFTRSQFLLPDVWREQDMLESYTFLRHDHAWLNQQYLKDDLRYWYYDANSHLLGVVRDWHCKLVYYRFHRQKQRLIPKF